MSVSRRLLAAATIATALSMPAAAQAGWSAPMPVSPADRSGSVSEIDIGFDADGDAVAAWTQMPPGGATELWVATRPAGGTWSAPKLLAGDDPVYEGDDAFAPTVVVHPGGRAVVQWTENTPKIPSRTVVAVAVGEAGGQIGDPFIPHATNVNQDAAAPVFDAAGNLHLAYNAGLSADNRIYERSLPAGATTWSEATPVAPAMSVPQYELDLDVDADGNRALVWTSDYIDEQDVNAAVRPAGGDWTAPSQLELNVTAGTNPRVAIVPQGRVVAAWGPVRMSAYGIHADAPSWSAPADMLSDEAMIDLQRDEAGVLHLLTRKDSGLRHRTMAGDSTTFGSPDDVDGTPSAHEHDPVLAVGPDGETAVTWHDLGGPIRVALVGSDPESVTPDGLVAHASGSVAWDHLGNVVAGVPVQRVADGPQAADVVVLDRTAPQLVEASFQSSGIAGHPLSFSASAVEDWSEITFEWTFGDGAKASGASVEHAWAAAGRSTATLRIVSAGGAEQLEPVEIEIAPAPVGEDHHEEPKVETPTTTTVTRPVATPQPAPPALPTVAEVVKVLGTFPSAPVATTAAATFQQTFPGPGRARWDLFLGRPPVKLATAAAAKKKPVLLGSATRTIAAAGRVKATVRIGARRRGALKRARRPAVYLRTTFTDAAGRRIETVRKVRFERGR